VPLARSPASEYDAGVTAGAITLSRAFLLLSCRVLDSMGDSAYARLSFSLSGLKTGFASFQMRGLRFLRFVVLKR
jgi:hypothetical protein